MYFVRWAMRPWNRVELIFYDWFSYYSKLNYNTWGARVASLSYFKNRIKFHGVKKQKSPIILRMKGSRLIKIKYLLMVLLVNKVAVLETQM